MKLPTFAYHAPATAEEALALLSELGDEAKVLAGGQSLLPLMALRLSRPAHLVDIGRATGFGGIEERDGRLAVGATVRHAGVEGSAAARRVTPLLAGAVPFIGHRAIRNRGTVCGSLAHADPAGELPAVALAHDAEIVLRRSGGERVVPAAKFFRGYLTSAIEADEILTEVRFPATSPTAGWSVREITRRHGDFALLGLAVLLDTTAGGEVSSAAISLFGASSQPVRAEEAERLLVGEQPTPQLFEAAGDAVSAEIEPPDDDHATAAYRRHVAGVLTRRCLAEAAGRLGEAA